MCLTAFKAVLYMGGDGVEEEQNNNDRKMIRRPPPTDQDKWNALPEVPTRSEMGFLHLSFEYHRGMLRVRVWQISDLLLPPPQISMIHSLFVRGYFLPDKVRKTHRRTEEIVIGVPDPDSVDAAKTGIQHIFTPSSFKFKTPLLYTGVTAAIIKERSLQLEVCMTQKKTQRVYLMAMVHMPLRTAIRRPIREKYPLIPCNNITIPNNMRVYSAAHLLADSAKGGDSTFNGGVTSLSNGVNDKKDEEELDDAVSLSGEDFLRSHLSLCLDEDSDDDGLAVSDGSGRIHEGLSSSGADSGDSSNTTLNLASSSDDVCDEDYDEDDDERDDNELDRTLDTEQFNARSTPVQPEKIPTCGSKKKIIPSELFHRDALDDLTVDTPSENGVQERESPSPDIGQESLESVSSPDTNTALKKIIPLEKSSPKASPTPEVHPVPKIEISGTDDPHNGDSEQGNIAPQKKQVNDLGVHSSAQLQSTHKSTSSDGTSSEGSGLSPLQDSAFSPASRPETPCWDFYDFAEDLQPAEDLELAGRSLEESLAQLRQHGIGSLQNLSKEPILPMDLVDDFDSLAVDAEQAENCE